MSCALGLVMIAYLVLIWWCASMLAEPKRREVQTVSKSYLDKSSRSGFRIAHSLSSQGMPYVICTPEATRKLSKRAEVIRDQLRERGMEPAHSGEILGTLLILHGRGGMKEDYLPVAERFGAVGFQCVIPDLPAHGKNKEKYTTYGVLEAEMVLECFQEAARKYGFAEIPSAILGQSMGGSVAIHTAALDDSPFGCIVIIASFDKLETVVREKSNRLLGAVLSGAVQTPVNELFRWKTGVDVLSISPRDKAPLIQIPTMVVHGDSDTFVPAYSGKTLFDSLPETIDKEWISVPGADHDNVLITDFPLYVTMAEWLLKHLRPLPGG